jgi:hypothetical protein
VVVLPRVVPFVVFRVVLAGVAGLRALRRRPVGGQGDGARFARAAGFQAGPEAAGSGGLGLMAGRERGGQAGLP